MKQNDLKLYFVAAALESPDQRILYAVDIRDKFMMLSEKMARGRAGTVPLISEKVVQNVTVSADLLTFTGPAEVITRKLVGAFSSLARATKCYGVLDVRPRDSRWEEETGEVLQHFKPATEQRCSFGDMQLAV